jgi:hypothetical protein
MVLGIEMPRLGFLSVTSRSIRPPRCRIEPKNFPSLQALFLTHVLPDIPTPLSGMADLVYMGPLNAARQFWQHWEEIVPNLPDLRYFNFGILHRDRAERGTFDPSLPLDLGMYEEVSLENFLEGVERSFVTSSFPHLRSLALTWQPHCDEGYQRFIHLLVRNNKRRTPV